MKQIIFAGAIVLAGCSAMIPPDSYPITTEPREFTYDFQVPGKSKAEIFKAALQHFSMAYGDGRAVERSANEADGIYTGKALIRWTLLASHAGFIKNHCLSNYDIIFIAKDGKARLQLALLEGAPPLSSCQGWPLPPKADYPQITTQFNASAKEIEAALQGNSKIDSLRNF